MSLYNFIKDNQLNDKKELIFFGGSFNPWHEGHSECLRLIDSNKSIIVIPDKNPRKDIDSNKGLNLYEIITKIQSIHKNALVYEGFYSLNKKNPTAHWINDLFEKLPNTELSLLMGYDSFKTLPTWINSDQLLTQLGKLYIASRLETDKEREQIKETILSKNPKININFLGHHPYEEISSTKLREES